MLYTDLHTDFVKFTEIELRYNQGGQEVSWQFNTRQFGARQSGARRNCIKI